MKKNSLMTLMTLLTLLNGLILGSCSTDETTVDVYPRAMQNGNTAKAVIYPENQFNVYDAAGQLHYRIAEDYINTVPATGTTAETVAAVETIANANPVFLSVKPVGYVTPAASRIDYIVANGENAAFDIVWNSAMGNKAKLGLSTFVDVLMDYSETNATYETVYSYIISFEGQIINDASLSSNDKRIMLTTSSIARYGFYLKKKRPRDRDWDISWGNIVAGTEGGEDMAKAVVMSVATGIVINK